MQNPKPPSHFCGEKNPSNLSHYAPNHPNFHQSFFQILANCSLNNAPCASTIQGKWRGIEARRACQASNPRFAPPAPIHGGPGRLRPFNHPGDFQPCRIRRHGGAGPSARLNPAESALMFPKALSALRPTARQRRESGAKGRDHSGTFRPRNRTLDYVLFPQAIRPYPDLWHAGGAPPNRRHLGWGPLPNHPLVRSLSHRIAMPRQHAPAHRGTDPPGVFINFFPLHKWRGKCPQGKG